MVFFNGNYVPESEAKISIYDSSLMFGDMVFEMTRSFNKKHFLLNEHIDRLYKSAIMLCVDFILLCLAVYFSFALRLGEIWPSQGSDFLFYISRSAWIFLVLPIIYFKNIIIYNYIFKNFELFPLHVFFVLIVPQPFPKH